MQKFFKRLSGRLKRLAKNVRSGSIVDIALLCVGGALIITIIALLAAGIFSGNENDGPISLEDPSKPTYSNTDTTTDGADKNSEVQINPFSSTGSTATSQAASTATSASSSAAVSSAAVSTAQSQATSTAPASSSVAQAHTHTYGAWVREGATCEATFEIRTCTGCTPGTEGHEERRAVMASEEHRWGTQTLIFKEGNSEAVGFSTTCDRCDAVWTEYYE